MKVLLGVAAYPASTGLPPVFPATQASIDALQYDGHLDIGTYIDDDPKLSAKENLTDKHNSMRHMVLSHDHDALFLVEADMLIPPDALTKLAAVMESENVGVVYGLYCARSTAMWLCFPEINGYRGVAINANPDEARAAWGKVIKSEGVHLGCTLIHRRVLEKVEFRLEARKRFTDDWSFALDVKAAGFTQAHHMGVVCGHILHEGGVLWPDPDAPRLHRIDGKAAPQAASKPLPPRATYRVLRRLSGPSREYLPGDEIELDAEEAAVLFERRAVEQIQET